MGLSPEALKKRIVHRAVNPLLESLPDWVQGYRPHQVSAVSKIVEAFERVPVVVLDAPTGAGKTLIAETVRRELEVARTIYMCGTKSLQDQFLRDFPYAKVLKGRGNYPTINRAQDFHPESYYGHVSCEDCTWNGSSCVFCPSKGVCPYEVAKMAATSSELCVTNTAYFLGETSMGDRSRLAGWDLVVADEADTLEGELMGFVSVEISERRMEQWGWHPPDRVTVKESWAGWLDEKIPLVKEMAKRLPDRSTDLKVSREKRFLESLYGKLVYVRAGLDDSDSPWVYTGKGAEGSGRVKERNQGRAVSFKPARVDAMGEDILWAKADRWLLMSATVISAEEMLESLGYTGAWEYVPVASTFPVENRRVVYQPVANMTAKQKETAYPKMAEGVVAVVNSHPEDRILVHTVSYDLARYLHARLSNLYDLRGNIRRSVTYSGAGERDAALADYLSQPSSILVAPSMDRGIDLPGDACRVQVIAKVPFPYLGDRQVSARMHSRGGQVWYTVATIRTIVQMCGRAVRSAEDWAVTYVLDSQFETGVFSRGRGLIPEWFREAVVWDNRGRNNGRAS